MSPESLDQLERAFRERPADGETVFAYAQALDRADREAEAIPIYRRALGCPLPVETEYRASVQLASSLRATGRPQAAIDLHRQIGDRWPDRPANKLFLALALLDVGTPTEAAVEAIEAALCAEPDEDVRYYRRALQEYAAEQRGR